ncbi:MAG: ATP-binding protein [Desulfobulbaceae bacterium]|nr:ATP-binding protein [Desulfobulbaceae bacterium]
MRLRILHKMLLAFSLYLAIAFCFGLFVYIQMGQIMARQTLVEIADDIKEELLELRRNEKNYIIRRDPIYLEKIDTIINKLKANLTNFRPHLLSAFNEQEYQTLMDAVVAYASLIEKFGSNYHTTASLKEKLRNIGRAIEQKVLATNNYLLTKEILEIRLIEKNYILFQQTDYLLKLKEQVPELRAKLASMHLDCPLCDDYINTAEALFKYHANESALLASIGRQANTMESIIIVLARKERENIAGYVRNTQRILYVALIALTLFGFVLSVILSKAILSPLQKLESTVRKINAGEFDLRLDTGGDVETASLQKSFNTMLDTLDLARESLAQTIQLLQDKSIQLIESEKLASIGILASGVAHEINNPLANISLTAETMRDEGDTLTEAEKEELIADIIDQTDRASDVVHNLLGYARSMKNSKTDVVNIISVLKNAVTLVAHELKLHDIHLTTDLPESSHWVKGNKGRLEQVFVNIMLNGIQAMDNNGQLALRAAVEQENESIVIEIEDNGASISHDTLKNIFDPFFTTKSAGEGTGLGLYVSYGII